MPSLLRSLGIVAAVALAAPVVVARAGVVGLDIDRAQQTVAMDPRGDLVATGAVRIGRNFATIGVAKMSGTTGQLLWSRHITGQQRQPGDDVGAVAIDAAGDVFVGGSLYRKFRSVFAVAKLSGRTGARRWLTIVPSVAPGKYGSDGGVTHLAVDGNGDVVVDGVLADAEGDLVSTIVRLGGGTGAIQWRYRDTGFALAEGIAIDGHGDVVAAGDPGAIKLAGSDGHVLWRDSATPAFVRALRVDAHDDVVLGGAVGPQQSFGAAKLSGSDGHLLWAATIVTSPGYWQSAWDVRVDATGDVIAAGFTADPGSGPPRNVDLNTFTVAKFAGDTGNERWRRMIVGTGESGPATARSLLVDPAGDVVVTGTILNAKTCFDWFVGKLTGASGDVVWQRSFDGTEKARQCQWDNSDGGGPPPLHFGTDKDIGEDVMLDAKGRVVAVGLLSNRGHAPLKRTLTVKQLSLATGGRAN